ncbi:hypothetical protein [Streptomyces africanus]|uniref:hypothetical protein n=1 Tax=Streptomyces africanus TaxID=231024 RepID=UPI000A3B3646|nr:hypothetical protein [Streptomyces africanus]
MEQSGTSSLLQDAVQELASGVVSALRSGDHARAAAPAAADGGAQGLTLAAVRVLGADALLPSTLLHVPPLPDELARFRQAVEAYPPGAGAAPTVAWSHWAMRRTLRRLDPGRADGPDDEPDATWLEGATWHVLTHQLAVLAPLALPGEDCAVARAAGQRPVDVARGFVRAVRRRDWRQAAGAGRWLTLLEGVPRTLGLENGLDFVELMGGQDPLVALQVRAARLTRAGAFV